MSSLWAVTLSGEKSLILISVGAFLATKLISARPQQVSAVYALFPSLSHLVQSRGGKRLGFLLAGLGTPLVLLFQLLFSFLPYAFVLFLVRLFVPMRSDAGSRGLAAYVVQPACLAACIALAKDEFVKIDQVDHAYFKQFASRTSFYWAAGDIDLYIPDKDVQEIVAVLEQEVPERKARRLRCERGMRHAFSLQTSDEMAEIVAGWLQEDFLGRKTARNGRVGAVDVRKPSASP